MASASGRHLRSYRSQAAEAGTGELLTLEALLDVFNDTEAEGSRTPTP